MKRLVFLLALLLTGCDDSPSALEGKPSVSLPNEGELRQTTEYSGENAFIHCHNICSLGPRPSGSEAYQAQLEYLSKHLAAAGWQVTPRSFSLTNGLGMTNLHATFGVQEATRPIIITCHIDTKIGIGPNFVGADDGASAAAAMLELARILSSTPEQASQVELIFFDGEESFAPRMTENDGLYGSRYEVQRRRNALPRYQINLDMVGARNKTIAIPLMDTDAVMLQEYEKAITELGFSERRWTVHHGSYMDDHTPFLEAGVHSLNLITDFLRGGWWHTEKDAMDRICPNSLRESGEMTLQLIRQLTAKTE